MQCDPNVPDSARFGITGWYLVLGKVLACHAFRQEIHEDEWYSFTRWVSLFYNFLVGMLFLSFHSIGVDLFFTMDFMQMGVEVVPTWVPARTRCRGNSEVAQVALVEHMNTLHSTQPLREVPDHSPVPGGWIPYPSVNDFETIVWYSWISRWDLNYYRPRT